MKIREVRSAGLRGMVSEGGWPTVLRPEDCLYTLVTVLTDEGLTGIGSVYTNDELVRSALLVLAPLCIGENALEPERLSEKLHQNMFWLGRGGPITHAISGIDIAIWDILGQATGQPVGRLLGGRYRERVRPYASLVMKEPAPMRDHLLSVKAQGFHAFKIGWGPFGHHGERLDEEIVRTARETIGPDNLLFVDAGACNAFWNQDYKWALRTSQMLAHYDVAWFEEPLKPDSMQDYILLRQQAPLPIAAGEALTRRQAYVPWMQARALDIVQPDVTKVGGISEQRRIGWMASDNGIRLIGHGWNTAVGLAADLQMASALPDTDLVEFQTGSPFIDGIVQGGWSLDKDGMLPIPERPGLGLELDPDAVAKYTQGQLLLDK
jgi:D-galactarolactone cycloisomerase